MSRGQPDYWGSTLTSKSVWSSGQIPWYKTASNNVDPGYITTIFETTIPSDRALHLYSINWGSDSKYYCEGIMQKNGVIIATHNFEIGRDILLGVNAGYYFGPGDVLKVTAVTSSDQTEKVYINLVGFTQMH